MLIGCSIQAHPNYASCKINWDGTERDIIVYNKEFRLHHFKEHIAGVFTLGQPTIEDLEKIEEIKKQIFQNDNKLKEIESTKSKKDEELRKKDDKFKDNIWDIIYKQNNISFFEVFNGFKNSKEKFKSEIINKYNRLIENKDSYENLKKRYSKLFSQRLEKIKALDHYLK